MIVGQGDQFGCLLLCKGLLLSYMVGQGPSLPVVNKCIGD